MPGASYYRTAHWTNLRRQVLRRDRYTCQLCGTLALGKRRNGVSPHVDHIKQRPVNAQGPTGLDVAANCRTLCAACHNKETALDRGDKPVIGPNGFVVGSDWN